MVFRDFAARQRPLAPETSVGRHLAASAGYTILALALFSGFWPDPTAAYVGVGQDPKQFMWFLAWTPYALSHHLNPLLTDWIFSQSGVNLTWNTAVPLIGAFMAPVTGTAGPILSYNLAMVLGLIASAWTAYYVALRVFRCGYLAALLAGAMYGFSPFTMAHAGGHLHLTAAFTPPLFLLILHDVFVTQRHAPWVNGARLAALAVIQYFISAEVLLTVGLLSLGAACVLAAACRPARTDGRVAYAARTVSLAVLFALPLLFYPVYLMLFGPWQPRQPLHPPPSVAATDLTAADVVSFIIPTGVQAIAPAGFRLTPAAEIDTYLGIPLILLLAVVLRAKGADRTVQFLFVVLAGAIVLSLGPSLHAGGDVADAIPLPWRLFQRVPLFQDILPTRFGEYTYLLAGLILAIYISDPSASWGRRTARLTAGVVAAAFLLPRMPLPYSANRVELPEFFQRPLALQGIESPVLVVPLSDNRDATAMLWQAQAGMAFKMPEGYAFGPGGGHLEPEPTPLSDALSSIEGSARAPAVTPELRARVVGTVRSLRVRTVLLGPSRHEREALRFLEQSLGWAPEEVGGVYVWRHVDARIQY